MLLTLVAACSPIDRGVMLDIEAFWSKVRRGAKEDCWPWLAGTTGDSYGQFCVPGRILYAHRVAWGIANGLDIPPGIEVLHSCDNPICVNPTHLHLGTHRDNMLEKVSRGRHNSPSGERSGMAKLTWESVRAIRKLYGTGTYSTRKLGAMFGVSNRNISDVTRRVTWRD